MSKESDQKTVSQQPAQPTPAPSGSSGADKAKAAGKPSTRSYGTRVVNDSADE